MKRQIAELQVQLRQAQTLESLGALARGIAHDFNNFLTIIIAHCQLAGKDLTKDHPASRNLELIMKAGQSACAMVGQILSLAKSQNPKRQVLDLEPVVRESLSFASATLPTSIRLETHFATKSVRVLANVEQIHRALLNLISNAVDSMAEHGGCLAISLQTVRVDETLASAPYGLRTGPYVRLSVQDTGRGMDAVTMERIFEPFFSTKSAGRGAGLGLFIVDSIMKNHDGAVSVHSHTNQGTAFHLYFPEVPVEEAAGAP